MGFADTISLTVIIIASAAIAKIAEPVSGATAGVQFGVDLLVRRVAGEGAGRLGVGDDRRTEVLSVNGAKTLVRYLFVYFFQYFSCLSIKDFFIFLFFQ